MYYAVMRLQKWSVPLNNGSVGHIELFDSHENAEKAVAEKYGNTPTDIIPFKGGSTANENTKHPGNKRNRKKSPGSSNHEQV